MNDHNYLCLKEISIKGKIYQLFGGGTISVSAIVASNPVFSNTTKGGFLTKDTTTIDPTFSTDNDMWSLDKLGLAIVEGVSKATAVTFQVKFETQSGSTSN